MYSRITATSEFAKATLASQTKAAVHSVYRKTINLSFGEILLAVQAKDTVLSPVSLITSLSEEEMASLPVYPGDSVFVSQNIIEIKTQDCSYPAGSVSFAVNSAAQKNWDLSFSPSLAPSRLTALTDILETVLSCSHTGGLDKLFCPRHQEEDPSGVLKAADAYMKAASDAMSRKDWDSAAKELCGLIGLGHGLTPSGDDFLCGVLAGIQLINISDHRFSHSLKEQLLCRQKNTNDISRTFLTCALRNQFSLPVKELPNALSAEALLTEFKKIGHSSGTDTLCGIYFMCLHRDFF